MHMTSFLTDKPMKHINLMFAAAFGIILLGCCGNAMAQCSTSPNLFGSYTNTTCAYQEHRIGSNEYVRFHVTRCREYRFEIQPPPSNTGWSMQMTGRNDANNATLFYAAGTGVQAANWTANVTGFIRVYVNRSTCLGFQGAVQASHSAYLRYRDNGTNGITNNSQKTWRGGVSTAWSNGSNWDCGTVPTSETDVLIPGPCLNNPTIPTGTNANVRCIKVDGANGAVLTVDPTNPNITAHGTSLTTICQ